MTRKSERDPLAVPSLSDEIDDLKDAVNDLRRRGAVYLMDETVDGGPAFPNFVQMGEITAYAEGMSLTDYFAGQMLQSDWARVGINNLELQAAYAEFAYQMADAMLAERAKRREKAKKTGA